MCVGSVSATAHSTRMEVDARRRYGRCTTTLEQRDAIRALKQESDAERLRRAQENGVRLLQAAERLRPVSERFMKDIRAVVPDTVKVIEKKHVVLFSELLQQSLRDSQYKDAAESMHNEVFHLLLGGFPVDGPLGRAGFWPGVEYPQKEVKEPLKQRPRNPRGFAPEDQAEVARQAKVLQERGLWQEVPEERALAAGVALAFPVRQGAKVRACVDLRRANSATLPGEKMTLRGPRTAREIIEALQSRSDAARPTLQDKRDVAHDISVEVGLERRVGWRARLNVFPVYVWTFVMAWVWGVRVGFGCLPGGPRVVFRLGPIVLFWKKNEVGVRDALLSGRAAAVAPPPEAYSSVFEHVDDTAADADLYSPAFTPALSGTDLREYYYQYACREPSRNVVAVFDVAKRKWICYRSLVALVGSVSSVYGAVCLSEAHQLVLSRAFGLVVNIYIDDTSVFSRPGESAAAEHALVGLYFSLLGWPESFDKAECHSSVQRSIRQLGVAYTLCRAPDGRSALRLEVPEEKRERVALLGRALIAAFDRAEMTETQLAQFVGSARYALSYDRAAVGAVKALDQWTSFSEARKRGLFRCKQARACFGRAVALVCQLVSGARPLLLVREAQARVPQHIYTDASLENGVGGLGAVCFTGESIEFFACDPASWFGWPLKCLKNFDLDIGFYEALTALLACVVLRPGPNAILHCDNQADCFVLSSGGSRSAPTAAVAAAILTWEAEQACPLYKTWISTKRNPADDPSRGRVAALRSAFPGAVEVEVTPAHIRQVLSSVRAAFVSLSRTGRGGGAPDPGAPAPGAPSKRRKLE